MTGLMVPQRDPAALAVAIERLLEDPDLRVRLAGRARRLVEAEFDVHRNAAHLRDTSVRPMRHVPKSSGRQADREDPIHLS